MKAKNPYPIMTADEAVQFISDGNMVAFSGFTSAGAAKVIPKALASKAREQHDKGSNFKIKVLTGASTSEAIDKDLAEANAISWRAPSQSDKVIRNLINQRFSTHHLS
ncbi:hypothetical protein HN680_07455 [Candidatus Peregrinibacteria bacterium]|nr:hypothetical protein [Candidatus Peregrinibacteria bacterium]